MASSAGALRCGAENLTDRQRVRLDKAIAADERHDEVHMAWQCAQQLGSAYQAKNTAEADASPRRSSPACPIPEIRRLGKTLKHWRSVRRLLRAAKELDPWA